MDKHLLNYKGVKSFMLIIGVITLIQSVAVIIQAIFLAKAIVSMYEGAALKAVLTSFSYFLGAYVVRHFLQWLKEKIAYRFADQTANHYQNALVEKMFQMGPRTVGKLGSGQLITLALEGIPQFRTYLRLFIPRAIASFCLPVLVLIYLVTLDIPSAVLLAIVMPVMIIFLILLGLTARKHMDAQWDTYQLLSRHFVDSLRGLVTLKFLGKSKSHRKAIETVSNKYRIATNRTLRVAFLSTFSLDFFSSLSVAVVAVELGLRLINGNIGFEPALAILILAPEYFLPVRDLGNDYHATMDGKEAGEKIHELLAAPAEVPQMNSPIRKWNAESTLEIRDVVKHSEDEAEAMLNHISLSVQGFKKIGIIGSSGAGKSTLIDLLSGFTHPSSGTITVDGQALEHLSVTGWQDQLTYIPQHPYIFSGTVAENILFYEPGASTERLMQAVERAGLKELVDRFPNGINEKIGQGGRTLSGGEEQRIALARGLLQERPILLFDEPTAHLDIETEHELKQIITPVLDEKLVFLATHRLHWMKTMNLIIVLDHGEIVEMGTHDELMDRNQVYTKLVNAQRGGS